MANTHICIRLFVYYFCKHLTAIPTYDSLYWYMCVPHFFTAYEVTENTPNTGRIT